MLPIYIIQSQVFWQQEMPLKNIHPYNGSTPMQDIAKPLSMMFPANWVSVLIPQYALNPSGRSCPSDGLLNVPYLGSIIPTGFPKIMRYLFTLPRLLYYCYFSYFAEKVLAYWYSF